MNALEKKNHENNEKTGPLEKRESINPFLTNFRTNELSLSPLNKRNSVLKYTNSKEILEKLEKKPEIIKTVTRFSFIF